MRKLSISKSVLFISVCLMLILAGQSSGQRGGYRGIYGDWQIKIDYEGRQVESILSFSRNAEGKYTGQWISFWGATDLKDVVFEDGKLSFERNFRFGDNESTSKFEGSITEGKLEGTLTSDRGETKVEGKRLPRVSSAVGNWDMKIKVGEREFTGKLIVSADKEGKLSAKWDSEWGEHEITDVKYEERRLTFTRKSKIQDRQWESTFEGSPRDNTMEGVIKSERGEAPAVGTRIGADLIGKWNLVLTTERGEFKQVLRVNADMSGRYGSTVIEKVGFEGDKVSFKVTLKFGEREFEMSFAGTIAEGKMTGELTTSRGVQKVAGTKVIRSYTRRRSSQ